MASMTVVFIASEKASPLKERAYKPAALASFSKAAELYQPAVPQRSGSPGFSKNTPMVAAPEPKAAAMREDRP